MRRWITLGLAALLIAAASGCKKRAVEDEKAAQQSELRALTDAQTEQAKKLEQAHADYVAWRNTEAARSAEPEFKSDLAVAKRLTSQLSKQASKQQDKDAVSTIARLTGCLTALTAGAPASRIQQHLERAEMGLTSGDLEAAGAEILAAAGTAYNPSAPALVPDVLTQLEGAAEAVRGGDAAKAQELVSGVMDTTRADVTAGDLAGAHAIAVEAALSVERNAWPILIAQATQIAALLDGVEKRSAPEAKPEAPAAAEAETKSEAEPAPSATAPSPTETKQAEPAAPAKGGEEATPKSGETQPPAAAPR